MELSALLAKLMELYPTPVLNKEVKKFIIFPTVG